MKNVMIETIALNGRNTQLIDCDTGQIIPRVIGIDINVRMGQPTTATMICDEYTEQVHIWGVNCRDIW